MSLLYIPVNSNLFSIKSRFKKKNQNSSKNEEVRHRKYEKLLTHASRAQEYKNRPSQMVG